MARLATTPVEGNRKKRTMTVHPPATAQPTLCASQFKEPEFQKDDWSTASVLEEGHAFMASRLNGSGDTERMRDKESGPFLVLNCYFYRHWRPGKWITFSIANVGPQPWPWLRRSVIEVKLVLKRSSLVQLLPRIALSPEGLGVILRAWWLKGTRLKYAGPMLRR